MPEVKTVFPKHVHRDSRSHLTKRCSRVLILLCLENTLKSRMSRVVWLSQCVFKRLSGSFTRLSSAPKREQLFQDGHLGVCNTLKRYPIFGPFNAHFGRSHVPHHFCVLWRANSITWTLCRIARARRAFSGAKHWRHVLRFIHGERLPHSDRFLTFAASMFHMALHKHLSPGSLSAEVNLQCWLVKQVKGGLVFGPMSSQVTENEGRGGAGSSPPYTSSQCPKLLGEVGQKVQTCFNREQRLPQPKSAGG